MRSSKETETPTETATSPEGAALAVPHEETITAAETIKPEQRIYCGPSLQRGVLNQNVVYLGELPKHIHGHVEKCPAIAQLLVPVEKLTETQMAIGQPGTPEHIWYGQISKYIAGGDTE